MGLQRDLRAAADMSGRKKLRGIIACGEKVCVLLEDQTGGPSSRPVGTAFSSAFNLRLMAGFATESGRTMDPEGDNGGYRGGRQNREKAVWVIAVAGRRLPFRKSLC